MGITVKGLDATITYSVYRFSFYPSIEREESILRWKTEVLQEEAIHGTLPTSFSHTPISEE